MPRHPKDIFEGSLSGSEKLAQRIVGFTGTMVFVWLHTIIFIFWIVFNNLAGAKAWDPYPFSFLTFIVSLEAIMLSTFVLIAQNREARRNEIREQLEYEINVKAEKEIQELKRMLQELIQINQKKK